MTEKFAYDLIATDDIKETAQKNRETEDRVIKIVENAMSKHKKEFEENDISYELKLLQGIAEIDVTNINEESDLGREVKNTFIAIGTLIGASEH